MCAVSKLQRQSVSLFLGCHSAPIASGHDQTCCPEMSRWSIQEGNLRSDCLHCRLPRTGNAHGYRAGLVPQVTLPNSWTFIAKLTETSFLTTLVFLSHRNPSHRVLYWHTRCT